MTNTYEITSSKQPAIDGIVTRNLILRVDCDSDCEDPSNFAGWKLVSFNRRHGSYESPYNYLVLNKDQELVGANIGINSKLRAGTAFVLSCHEHGSIHWALQGEAFNCPWDTAQVAGILLWTQDPSNLGAKSYTDRQKDARAFLRIYTNWCNGWCYWYSLETENGEHVDSCGGYYGIGDVKSAIKEALGEGDEIVEIVGECKDLFDVEDFR